MYQVVSLPCFKPCKGFLVYLEKIQCLIMACKVPLIQLLTYLTLSSITLPLTVSIPKKLTFSQYLEYANLIPDQAFAQAFPPSQGPFPRSLYGCPSITQIYMFTCNTLRKPCPHHSISSSSLAPDAFCFICFITLSSVFFKVVHLLIVSPAPHFLPKMLSHYGHRTLYLPY